MPIKTLKLVLLVALFSACSPQWHLKRALKKDPSIIDTVKVVTIDTVWIEVKKIDTLFKYNFDTVYFVKDSVKIKFFYQSRDSLVYIDVDCPDCPSIQTTEQKTTIVEKEAEGSFKNGLLAGIALAFVLLFIIKKLS